MSTKRKRWSEMTTMELAAATREFDDPSYQPPARKPTVKELAQLRRAQKKAATSRLRSELERCRYAHLGTHGFFADAKFRSILQLDPKLFDRTVSPEGRILQRIGEGARSRRGAAQGTARAIAARTDAGRTRRTHPTISRRREPA